MTGRLSWKREGCDLSQTCALWVHFPHPLAVKGGLGRSWQDPKCRLLIGLYFYPVVIGGSRREGVALNSLARQEH